MASTPTDSTTSSAPWPALDGLPGELLLMIKDELDESLESYAAMTLASRWLRFKTGTKIYDDLNPDERVKLLTLLEKDGPMVHCPWCRKLHSPERAIDNANDKRLRCMGGFIAPVGWPKSYHPLALYGLAKYQRKYDEGNRDRYDPVKALEVLTKLMTVPVETITEHSLNAIARTESWSHLVDTRGIFVRRQIYVLSPKTGQFCTQKFVVTQCVHHSTIISPGIIAGGVIRNVRASVRYERSFSPDYQPTGPETVGETHTCKHQQCRTEWCIEVLEPVAPPCDPISPVFQPRLTEDEARERAVVGVTTWFYLGKGESARDVAAGMSNARFLPLLPVGETGRGDVKGSIAEIFEESLRQSEGHE